MKQETSFYKIMRAFLIPFMVISFLGFIIFYKLISDKTKFFIVYIILIIIGFLIGIYYEFFQDKK